MRRTPRVVAAALLAAGLGSPARAASDPDALWRIVHGGCVPDQLAHHQPAPCARVDLAGGAAAGSAVLKDRRGVSQYLLVPTARITGIESPLLLAPGAANYFAAAWAAAPLVGAALHRPLPRPLPREDLALAINAETGRSQDQLHIHVDCIAPDVRAALDRAGPAIDGQWRPLPTALAGQRYRAIRLSGPALGGADPFRILAASLSQPAREMGRHTLVLVGDVQDGRPGFILLDGQASTLSWLAWLTLGIASGSGEALQDHACRIAG